MSIAIGIILPTQFSRRWHAELIGRLRQSGHRVSVSLSSYGATRKLDHILAFESLRFGPRLASRTTISPDDAHETPDLIINLSGRNNGASVPALTVLFDGHYSLEGTARSVLTGGQPVVQVLLDGAPIGIARPMVSERIWLTRALNDILIRTLDLLERCVRDVAAGRTRAPQPLVTAKSSTALTAAYWLGIAPKLAHRLFLKLRYKPFHWRVGYRFHPEPLAGLGFDSTAAGYAT
ncbi:MAG: hypothetical protein JWQ65_519, partial [Devosia sp.]|nr:hypothetical protein [Devosia sp.]